MLRLVYFKNLLNCLNVDENPFTDEALQLFEICSRFSFLLEENNGYIYDLGGPRGYYVLPAMRAVEQISDGLQGFRYAQFVFEECANNRRVSTLKVLLRVHQIWSGVL